MLQSFITAPRPDNYSMPAPVKALAVVTLFQYFLYTKSGDINGLEKSRIIPCFSVVPRNIEFEFLKQYSLINLSPELCFLLRISSRHNLQKTSLENCQNMEQDDSSDEYDYSCYDEKDMTL